MHGRHIGKHENGHVMPGAEAIMKIARIFDASVDYLLFDDSEPAASAEIRDKSLLKNFEAVDKMDEEDKLVIKSLVDAYIIKRHQMEGVLKSEKRRSYVRL
ncbi:MAG: transcriptional regulator [Deltaproteobacteria bacterium]|nr:transcriptional regulator [Deltaproteobacteria bacterium]